MAHAQGRPRAAFVRHFGAGRVLLLMTPCRVAASRALAIALTGSGCFADPLPIDVESTQGGDESGSGASSADAGTMADPGTDVGDETMAGSGGGSGDTGGCVAGEPGCARPGETVWTLVLGGGDNDGAYAIAIDGEHVVVVGEVGTPGGSAPWVARIDRDGELSWSQSTAVGEGINVLRDVAAIGGGEIAAVGSLAVGTLFQGLLEVRDAAGDSIASSPYAPTDLASLLGLTPKEDGGLWAVGEVALGGPPTPAQPLLVRYAPNGPGWTVDHSTADTGALASIEGTFFGADVAPNGDLVAVGSVREGASSDAAILLFSPGGDLLEGPITFGGRDSGDFVGVAVDDDGSAVAVGRQGTGPTSSEILIVRFTIDGPIASTSEIAWGDAAFTVANGFARDGETLFIALGMSSDPGLSAASFDGGILRWDGDASEPTWVVPFEPDSPGRDFASDVALAADGTIVACGVLTPPGSANGDAWIRKLAR